MMERAAALGDRDITTDGSSTDSKEEQQPRLDQEQLEEATSAALVAELLTIVMQLLGASKSLSLEKRLHPPRRRGRDEFRAKISRLKSLQDRFFDFFQKNAKEGSLCFWDTEFNGVLKKYAPDIPKADWECMLAHLMQTQWEKLAEIFPLLYRELFTLQESVEALRVLLKDGEITSRELIDAELRLFNKAIAFAKVWRDFMKFAARQEDKGASVYRQAGKSIHEINEFLRSIVLPPLQAAQDRALETGEHVPFVDGDEPSEDVGSGDSGGLVISSVTFDVMMSRTRAVSSVVRDRRSPADRDYETAVAAPAPTPAPASAPTLAPAPGS